MSNDNVDTNNDELKNFKHHIGTEIHDAWIDSNVRNLSVDVVRALQQRERTRTQRLVYGIPALVVAMGIVAVVVLYNPAPPVEPINIEVSEDFYISETDLSTALVADISEDEAVEMLTAQQISDHDLLTEQDLDILFKE